MFQHITNYIDIIQKTEISALELGNDEYFEKADCSKIARYYRKHEVNMKRQNNLTIGKRSEIIEIKNDAKLKVYPFDKGSEFDIMKEQEDIGKSNIIHYD